MDFRKTYNWVRRILGPFELVLTPVSTRSFAQFRQQDISQFRKGIDLFYQWCISATKIWWKLHLVGFSYDKKKKHKCSYVERQGVIMSTSQVCEINNNKKFTVLNLQIVCQKECGTIKWGHFLAAKSYFQCKGNMLVT